MDLIMLGTGNAEAIDAYNSSYVIQNGCEYFLVDTGGGNGILRQLRDAGIPWQEVRHIFVTHRHIDHSLGVLWLLRAVLMAAREGSHEGGVTVYGHGEIIGVIRTLVSLLFSPEHLERLDGLVDFREVQDGETVEVAGTSVTFFDVHAPKVLQFGYSMELPEGGRLVSCGDEPARLEVEAYTRDARFLMHEAYCLEEETALKEYMNGRHSTVQEAAAKAEELGAGNLILHHTQDNCLRERKQLYTQAARQHFDGPVFVPDDLERISLNSEEETQTTW
ncbi:MAG: MBL fold metallo-hydrolase [Clostridia bacterium]|nr:MBL fold metallo-hydrolase [Clostridia bacterium]